MCYTLNCIFVDSPDGPVKIEGGLDQHLLLCQTNPPAQFHINHPHNFLTPQCHKFILSRIAFGSVPLQLTSTQESANRLLSEHPAPSIRDLDDCSFVFFPRWIEGKSLCRQIGQNGDEIYLRVDSAFQMVGLNALDMYSIAEKDSRSFHGDQMDNKIRLEDVPEDAELRPNHKMETPYFADYDQTTDSPILDLDFGGQPAAFGGNTAGPSGFPESPKVRQTRADTKPSTAMQRSSSNTKGKNIFWAPKYQHNGDSQSRRMRKVNNRLRRAAHKVISYAEHSSDVE